MPDGSTNLEIQQQITRMYREQNQLLVAQARLMRGQLAVQTELAAAMQGIDADEITRRLAPFNQQLDEVIGNLDNLSSSGQAAFGNIATNAGTSADSIDQLGDSLISAGNNMQRLSIGGAVLDGLKKGVDLVTESFSSVGGIISTVVQGIQDLGTTVLGALLGPFQTLMDQARALPVSTEFFQAREEVREFFGSLATNEGAAVIDMFRQIQKGIGETGLTARRILGDRAAQLRAMNELAQGLGTTFTAVLDAGLIKSAGNVLAFQRGLGITNEEMKDFARNALTSGRSVDEVLRETANYAIQMGKAFGISSKLIGRDMAAMQSDLKRFGGLGAKAFSEVSVYARKLGLEVKSLTGIMDTFDNLDSAAQAAARLNQQFGIQIDTLGMLEEENPARRADMLREALNRAGVSYTDLDRRSKSYLATQIGMSEADAELLFNAKNRGLSLDEIKKRSESAEKKQLTQAEATKELADNIKRLAQNMAQLTEGGLFDQLIKGFMDGIMRSGEMRRLLHNVREVMVTVYRAGIQLGQMFVNLFPGVRDILGGYADIFNPTRWRKSFGQIKEAVRDFFKAITVDPESGLRNLWTRLQEIFFGHMDATKPGGMKLIEGFKKFFGTILRVIVAAARVIIPELLKSLTDGIKFLNRMLKGEGGGLGIDFAGMWDSLKTSFKGLFEQLSELFTIVVPPLLEAFWNALKDFGTTLWAKIGPWFEENWQTILLGLAAVFAGPVIISSIVSGLSAMFSTVLTDLFAGGGMSSILAGVSGEVPGGGDPTAMIKKATETGEVVNASLGPLGQLIGNTVAIGAIMAGIAKLVSEIKNVAIDMKQSNLTATDVLAAVLAMGAAALLIGGLILMAKNLGPQEALGAAIAALSALVFNWVGSDVIKGFVRIVREDLLGPNGLFIAVKSFAEEIGGNLPNLEQMKAGFEMMQQMGTFLSSISGFLVEGSIAGSIDRVNQVMTDVGSSVNNMRTGVADFAENNFGVLGQAVGNFIRPDEVKENNQQLQKAPQQINRFAQLMGDMGAGITAFAAATMPLQAMGDITPRMKAVSVILEPLGDFLGELVPILQNINTKSTNINFDAANTVIQSILNGLSTFINNIISSGSQLANINAEQITGLASLYNVIGEQILGGLANVLQTLMSSELLALTGDTGRIETFTTFIRETLTNLFSNFGESFSQILRELAGLTTIITPEQANILSTLVPLFGNLLSGLNNMLKAIGDIMKAGLGAAGAIDSTAIANFLTLTYELFNQIKALLPGLLTSINESFKGVDVKGLRSKIPIFSDIFTALGNLTTLISNFRNLAKGAGGATEDISVGLKSINEMFKASPGNIDLFNVLDNVIKGFSRVDVTALPRPDLLTNIANTLKAFVDITTSLKSIADTEIPNTINQTFANINSALASFGNLRIPDTFPSQENLSLIKGSMISIADIAEALNRAVASINTGTNEAIAQLLNGLSDNIDLLNNIRPVNISTTLNQLASSIGLGSSESLTINNRNFTLQVNMTIRIDAETIERAIVSNPDGTLVITRGEFENNVTPPGFRSIERGPRRANVPRG